MPIEITWIKCSERMPPNTKDRVIIKGRYVTEPHYYFGSFINSAVIGEDKLNWEWTPYTPELWETLK